MFRKIVYSSPVEGFVHWQGKPLGNVVVSRSLFSGGFDGGKYTDTATTNNEGRFKFDVVQERRFLRPDLLSANPRVSQILTVDFNEHEYLIWSFTKLDFNLGTESKDGRLRLECDLSQFEEGASARIVRCSNNGVRPHYE